ncbi:ribonuclease H-like domain-containing protein [Tanacetum coccineum]
MNIVLKLSLWRRLKNLGCAVSEKNLVIYAINGLDSCFATLVEIIRHRVSFPTFETARNMLLLKESSFKDESGATTMFGNSSSSPTVLMASNSSSNKDDIILTSSSPALLLQIIASLHNEFDMTDLGVLNYFLGISAARTFAGLFLSQRKYALQLLERAHMVNCNPSRTPVDTDSKLGPEGIPVQDHTLYRSLAGDYNILHLHVQGTLDFGLQLYVSTTTSLVGYTDADWAGCRSTRRAEAEYHGVANIVAETAWLRILLRELHSPLSIAILV